MGSFLRCNLSVPCRMTKFLLETKKVECRRSIHLLSRLHSKEKPHSENESSLEGSSPISTSNDHVLADMIKFQDENKISLPRVIVESTDFETGSNDDPDTFGTLSNKNSYVLNNQEGDESDVLENKFTAELPNYLPQKEYAIKIKKYLNQRRFADALDVLQVTMLKEHRVKPEYYIYGILINFCGHTGYSKMAVKLYNEMKKQDLPVKSSIYTSLFNSFANSPFPSDGLKRTRHLFALMNEKGIAPNQITCHAIIKAFGRCGSVEEAFKVVDYMMQQKMQLKSETMSFLFHACISDKAAGFRHALLVYRKMMDYKIKPDVIHYNLLLHCTRSCSIGDMDSTIDVLRRLGVLNIDRLASGRVSQPHLEAGHPWDESEDLSATIVSGSRSKSFLNEGKEKGALTTNHNNEPTSLMPNLFSNPPTLGCVVSLTQMETPQDRLFMLGGIEGFLIEMSRFNVKTDIKTINLLLDCSPDTCASEEFLVKLARRLDLKTDILFFNSIIRRRVKRQQYSEAKEVLSMITSEGLQPDLMTFTNLAMTCRRIHDAYELLKAMDECGLRPGIELVTAMLGCATGDYQIKYVNLVLDVIDYEEMKVNSLFLKKANEFYEKCRRVIKIRPEKFTSLTIDAMQNFCKRYHDWRENVSVEKEQHPWQQFKERYPQDTQTDKEFFNNVEKHVVTKPQFSRLGPNTSPKVKVAKRRELKKENPDMFLNKGLNRTIKDQLEGLESVAYQKLAPKQ